MDAAVKLAALAVCAAMLTLLVKKSNAEIALVLALAAGGVTLAFTLSLASSVAEAARRARELSGLSTAVYSPLVKCVAVAIVCSLAADACRDAENRLLASCVDFAGAVCALFCALPLISALLDTVEGFA